MARPRSEDKRNSILKAATRVIVTDGLNASTAAIAKEAGVANGSFFTYFETKTDLFNELYLDLKVGMASAAVKGLPQKGTLHEKLFHVWTNWMTWAVSSPEKRRALSQLSVSDEITPVSRAAAHKAMSRIAALLEQCRLNGSMRGVPMLFVASIMSSLADATMDLMVQDPKHAKKLCEIGFDALWRVLN